MHTASFSPDGAHIVTLDEDGQTWLWKTHALPQFLAEHKNQANLLAYSQANLLAYSQDGSRLLTASTTGRTAYLWDADGRLLFAKNNIPQMSTIAMNPQNTRFVLGQSLWDDQGRLIASLDGPYRIHGMFSAQFTPDGSRLLTTYTTGEVYLWDGQDGTRLAILQEHSRDDVVNSAVFNHDGTRILSTNNTHQSVYLHNADGKLITILNGHRPHNITTALFSQDGEFILSITDNGDIRLWDKQGQLSAPAKVYGECVHGRFNWNGTHFFTASDSYVRLGNSDTLQFDTVTECDRPLDPYALFNHRGTHLLILETQGRVQLFGINEAGKPRRISQLVYGRGRQSSLV